MARCSARLGGFRVCDLGRPGPRPTLFRFQDDSGQAGALPPRRGPAPTRTSLCASWPWAAALTAGHGGIRPDRARRRGRPQVRTRTGAVSDRTTRTAPRHALSKGSPALSAPHECLQACGRRPRTRTGGRGGFCMAAAVSAERLSCRYCVLRFSGNGRGKPNSDTENPPRPASDNASRAVLGLGPAIERRSRPLAFGRQI